MTGQKPAITDGKRLEPMADDRDGAGKFQFLSEVLKWRAQTNPDHQLFSLLNEKVKVPSACFRKKILKLFPGRSSEIDDVQSTSEAIRTNWCECHGKGRSIDGRSRRPAFLSRSDTYYDFLFYFRVVFLFFVV